MKIAPLLEAFSDDEDFATTLIHTGQHYDDNMSGSFFRELRISPPQYHLEVGSGSHAQQTAEIMRRLEPVLLEIGAQGVVVVGDVNSTVAGALVAAKLNISVIHAEAGLRSFDRFMPEEVNRVVTDSISDLLLVTEESGRINLLTEGCDPNKIVLVGNLMVDSLRRHLQESLKSDIQLRIGAGQDRFGLVTLHRPTNVDDKEKLREILEALAAVADDLPLYWPVHPRARARIESSSLRLSPRVHLLEPLGYFDFLHLQAKCAVVLTDSGGIQEESTVLGIPCLTLRDNTERPITIECGTNRLAGTTRESILRAWCETRDSPKRGSIPPLWDGRTGIRCHDAIRKHFRNRVLDGTINGSTKELTFTR
jgi:UDP-N-acetylglucosamine 2-epimerase (non-hydrolysing)